MFVPHDPFVREAMEAMLLLNLGKLASKCGGMTTTQSEAALTLAHS